jgi:quercetin dioxygenase-like cupin family protein
MRRRLRAALVATALAVVALAAGPPLVNAITTRLFVIATLEPVKVNNDGIKLKTKAPTDVHVQETTFEPGDFVDWHDHPGFALIAVSSGEMTFLDPDCTRHVVGPGEAFVESGGPTYAVNEGSQPALFYVTYVVPQGSPRIVPTDPPRCATGEDEDDDRHGDDRKDKDRDRHGDDRKDKDDDRHGDDWDRDD